MGRIKNIVSAKIKGNTGAVNFRKRSDAIVVGQRSYTNAGKAENATASQRIHRLRWCNVVEFYNSIKPILQRSWQGPVSNLTSWNRFTKANLKNSPVFLTKKEAELHAAVIAPYLVSSGQLSPIKGEYGQGRFLTNIKIGAGSDLPNISVADFAAAVVAANDGWKYGDKLSVCRMIQLSVYKGGVEIPKISANFMEISLDPSDSSLLSEQPWWDSFTPILGAYGDFILPLGGDAAFGVHSRNDNGMLLVSSQDVVLADPENPVFVKYSSEEQLSAAMDSYGFREEIPLAETIITPKLIFFDFLQTDGVAYINTNYQPNMQYNYSAKFQQLAIDSGAVFGLRLGTASAGRSFILNIQANTLLYRAVCNTTVTAALYKYFDEVSDLQIHEFRLTNGIFYFDDKNYGAPSGFSRNYTFPIPIALGGFFTDNVETVTALTAIRIFEFIVNDGEGNEYLHLKPCTYHGHPGMWDTVSNNFFGNAAGEGDLSVGNL